MMSKRLVGLALSTVIVLWCSRIYGINQTEKKEYIIPMQETYYGESISITPLESHLFDREDFLQYFPIEEEMLSVAGDSNCKFICVCIQVSNLSQQDITWDWVMDVTSCGFETKTWASTNITYIGSKINIFSDDSLQVGQSQKIWYVTIVNPVCFKNETWEQLKCDEFRYVLALGDEKICIQLE